MNLLRYCTVRLAVGQATSEVHRVNIVLVDERVVRVDAAGRGRVEVGLNCVLEKVVLQKLAHIEALLRVDLDDGTADCGSDSNPIRLNENGDTPVTWTYTVTWKPSRVA